MPEDNKHNLVYFESPIMRDLYKSMEDWQKTQGKRFLSASIQQDGDNFCCIALTNTVLLTFVRFVIKLNQLLISSFHFAVNKYRLERQQENLRLKRKDSIKTYFELHPVRKLQVVAGYFSLNGWLNTDFAPILEDIIFLDVTEPFPFYDNSFDYIFSEHLLEHITYIQARFMLDENYRILKPGGKIRIATPDIRRFIGLYTSDKSDLQKQYLELADTYLGNYFPSDIGSTKECFMVNLIFREWNLQSIYDLETLKDVLKKSNFIHIVEYSPGVSDDDNLQGIELHGKSVGDFKNQFEPMVVEAQKECLPSA